MVAPVVIGAGAMALVRLIAWLSSAVLITSYVRDILTKEPGEDVEISRDDVVEKILDNPDLTEEQKEKALLEYLKISGSGGGGLEEYAKYIPVAVAGFVAISIFRR
ncbi:hypothetical protein J2755_000673 [Methanohalophilus levihalophilus]|uniref:hypothetical protein n=1 Tax=Methanohalophilus levihalophilus TaxID=1431282 RepID=UPI001AE6B03D|nr:hypothetical protein [Methanohalophilus levihalophilus]MBP2029753.1 hypothetical protein [Methanohalophilus levihalophilus]